MPAEHRGVSSGMCATFRNTAHTLSITIIFALLMLGLASSPPRVLYGGLTQARIPNAVTRGAANLPPTAALFAVFLEYNPIGTLTRGGRYVYEHSGHEPSAEPTSERRSATVTLLHSDEDHRGPALRST